MTSYKYIPIDYFTYNRPDYFAAVLVFILFLIFFIILYIVFYYEYLNRIDECHPMFYYGKACQNKNSRELLENPKFLQFKKMFYNIVSKYDTLKGEYKGVRESTEKNKNKIEESEKLITNNIENNNSFIEKSVEEVKKLTAISNLIASKYLGNLETIMKTVEGLPKNVLKSLGQMPQHLAQLKDQIQETIVDPLFSQYTGPLKKLYRSLTEINDKTNTYIQSNK